MSYANVKEITATRPCDGCGAKPGEPCVGEEEGFVHVNRHPASGFDPLRWAQARAKFFTEKLDPEAPAPNPTAVAGPSLVDPDGTTLREPGALDESLLELDVALLDLWRRGREVGFRGGPPDARDLEKRDVCIVKIHELWGRRS